MSQPPAAPAAEEASGEASSDSRALYAQRAIVLGLLAAVGPFAIDMYLPAFQGIASELNTRVELVQLSLTSYFAAVAMFELVYGPLSDRIGRKPPLYFGLSLFFLGAIGCALAPNVESLIAIRFIQGIGGCSTMVIMRAVVRDLYTGPDAAQLMGTIMLVISVAPMLAPLTGSAIVAYANWRVIFWVVAGIGAFALVLIHFALPETRPPGTRQEGSIGSVLRTYGVLLRQPRFLGLVFIGGLGIGGFFAYLGESSDVFQKHYGLSAQGFSGVFAANAAFFIGGAQLNSWLLRRFGARTLLLRTSLGFLLLAAGLLTTWFLGHASLFVLCGFLAGMFALLGVLVPVSTVVALDDHGPIAGSASALLGSLRLGVGALTIGGVSAFHDGTPLPMLVNFALCATGTVLLTRLTIREDAAAAVA